MLTTASLPVDTDGGKGMAPCSSDLYTCDYDTCYQSNFSLPSASIVLRSDQIAALSLATTVTTTATAASVTITSAMTMTSSTRATCSSSQQGDPGDTHLAYSNSTNSSKLAAVGAGVGIPLAVAALVALALLLQEKRRSRRLKRENQQLAERRHYELKALNGKYGPQYYSTQELMGQEPHELEQDVTYELGH
ncbi:hypothetical protein MMC08_000452 [Hypocenomyce scalaris]|nr:hypothetical protein [Hypocenomyce scalaris]